MAPLSEDKEGKIKKIYKVSNSLQVRNAALTYE